MLIFLCTQTKKKNERLWYIASCEHCTLTLLTYVHFCFRPVGCEGVCVYVPIAMYKMPVPLLVFLLCCLCLCLCLYPCLCQCQCHYVQTVYKVEGDFSANHDQNNNIYCANFHRLKRRASERTNERTRRAYTHHYSATTCLLLNTWIYPFAVCFVLRINVLSNYHHDGEYREIFSLN